MMQKAQEKYEKRKEILDADAKERDKKARKRRGKRGWMFQANAKLERQVRRWRQEITIRETLISNAQASIESFARMMVPLTGEPKEES